MTVESAELDSVEEFEKCMEEEVILEETEAASNRFELNAADLVDRIIAILIMAAEGRIEEAEQAWQDLKLTPAQIMALSVADRKKAAYFVHRLFQLGIKASQDIYQALNTGIPREPAAKTWYHLTSREMGISVPLEYPDEADDGAKFILWKLGVAKRPTQGPWSMVP